MAIRPTTKPVRIFTDDETSLAMIAHLLKRGRADLFHEAWIEYTHAHRAELSSVFRETQEALAIGDVERLAKVSFDAIQPQIDDLMAALPR